MRNLLVAVALMGCGGSDDAREMPDAAVDAVPDAPAPTCAVDAARSCPDLGSGPTLSYTCSDGRNPAGEMPDAGLRCADVTGRGDYCCCVATDAAQTWPCN